MESVHISCPAPIVVIKTEENTGNNDNIPPIQSEPMIKQEFELPFPPSPSNMSIDTENITIQSDKDVASVQLSTFQANVEELTGMIDDAAVKFLSIQCHICLQYFKTYYSLKIHQKIEHFGYNCRICGGIFRRRWILGQHLKFIHNIEIKHRYTWQEHQERIKRMNDYYRKKYQNVLRKYYTYKPIKTETFNSSSIGVKIKTEPTPNIKTEIETGQGDSNIRTEPGQYSKDSVPMFNNGLAGVRIKVEPMD